MGLQSTQPYNTTVFDNQYIVAKNANPNYNIHIKCAGLGIEIVADIPEQTAYAAAGDYESTMSASSSDAGIAGNVGAYLTDTSATLDPLTRQIWRNSAPIEIPITILFDAETDALKEVYRPMRILEALAMPTIGGGYFLVSPSYGGNSISLNIGVMLNMSEVILVSAQNTYDTKLDHRGYPISGQCEVVFRTPKVMTRTEWMTATGIVGAF